MKIWYNTRLGPEAEKILREGAAGHELAAAPIRNASVLAAGQPDPRMAEADIAFGQPDPGDCLRYSKVRWVHLSTAGYARYDTDELRGALGSRGGVLSNSSAVFSEPAAQHALSMMLALGRNLLPAYRDQLGDHAWMFERRRATAQLLTGQTVVLLGFGAISRRLAELLGPFRCAIYAVRRRTQSERGVRIIREEDLTKVLPLADHVVNALPEGESTRHWVNARRIACFRQGAKFYNVGRGATVDQVALQEALRSGRIGAAYLDVTDPEPLPPDHPLWSEPNCYLTPHCAGGRHDQDQALVRLFLANLSAFEKGEPLPDRVY